MEKFESAEAGDKKLERLLGSYKKAHGASVKSKQKLVWHLAEISDSEKQVLEKHESGKPLEGLQEGEIWARARRKIEDAKMRFKDLVEIQEII